MDPKIESSPLASREETYHDMYRRCPSLISSARASPRCRRGRRPAPWYPSSNVEAASLRSQGPPRLQPRSPPGNSVDFQSISQPHRLPSAISLFSQPRPFRYPRAAFAAPVSPPVRPRNPPLVALALHMSCRLYSAQLVDCPFDSKWLVLVNCPRWTSRAPRCCLGRTHATYLPWDDKRTPGLLQNSRRTTAFCLDAQGAT
jgi:hypothetical protein